MSGAAVWTGIGLLALEALVLVGVAGLISRRMQSPQWERTIWQACFAALLGLLVLEFSGGARVLGRLAVSQPRKTDPVVAAAFAKPTPGPHAGVAAEFHGQKLDTPNDHINSPSQTGPPSAMGPSLPRASGDSLSVTVARLFVGTWFVGVLFILGLHGVARFRFAVLLRRSREVGAGTLLRQVTELAGQLGMTRRVRLFQSAQLVSPVAWGILRPAVGLPPGFDQEASLAEQDAMLAHEVAHLAAGDPAWYWVADVVGALLWWHPMVRWAKRRLHAASETAADEASLLVLDGPGVLAQSLVALGARLERPRPAAWLRIEGAGFRSGLARRVERLLKISGGKWSPPGRARTALARTVVPASFVMVLIFCVAWTVPETSTHGENMKKWKRSIGLLGLISKLAAAEQPALAADTEKTNARPEMPALGVRASSTTAMELKAKLEMIVIDEVAYDNLPLSEIIKSLRNEALKRDPEKLGVNFLFGRTAEAIRLDPVPTDPGTGLPIAKVDIQDPTTVTIRIIPPLKKVRLIDALDAIVRVADRPIKYVVEGYAVVLMLDGERINAMNSGILAPPPAPVLQTHALKVDTNVFYSSLEQMFGVSPNPMGNETGDILRHRVFPRLGLSMNSDRLVLYNPLTGVLLVRATSEEFVTIQACMEALSGTTTTTGIGNLSKRGESTPVAPRK